MDEWRIGKESRSNLSSILLTTLGAFGLSALPITIVLGHAKRLACSENGERDRQVPHLSWNYYLNKCLLDDGFGSGYIRLPFFEAVCFGERFTSSHRDELREE